MALTVSDGRMAPCFSGVELRVVGSQENSEAAKVVETRGWHPLVWGRELMRRDVSTLLCTGIDQVVWGGIRGHGIQVIPNAIGDAESVLAQWVAGGLVVPRTWPILPDMPGSGRGRGGGRGRRFRGGRR